MRLRELRMKKLLTIDELSKKAGLSSSTIRAIERGRELPSIKTARKLSETLEVKSEEIDEVQEALQKVLSKQNPINSK